MHTCTRETDHSDSVQEWLLPPTEPQRTHTLLMLMSAPPTFAPGEADFCKHLGTCTGGCPTQEKAAADGKHTPAWQEGCPEHPHVIPTLPWIFACTGAPFSALNLSCMEGQTLQGNSKAYEGLTIQVLNVTEGHFQMGHFMSRAFHFIFHLIIRGKYFKNVNTENKIILPRKKKKKMLASCPQGKEHCGFQKHSGLRHWPLVPLCPWQPSALGDVQFRDMLFPKSRHQTGHISCHPDQKPWKRGSWHRCWQLPPHKGHPLPQDP